MKPASLSLRITKPAVPKRTLDASKQMPNVMEVVSGVSRSSSWGCFSLQRICQLVAVATLAFGGQVVSGFVPTTPQRPPSSALQTATLGFLSFDLDDTLFPTTEVVNDANQVMIAQMQELGVATTEAEFLDTTRAIRKQLEGPGTYSTLRKLAISQEFKKHKPMENAKDHTAIVDECFEVWLSERHAAAERYLFADAISMLDTVKENYPDVCIAAITNGRGNPLDMPNTLAGYFDFCVSGEDANVHPNRKPHTGIYEESMRRYKEARPHHSQSRKDHIWCHVGDCLANDVGASTDAGAKGIWLDADEESPTIDSTVTQNATEVTPKWSTATKEDQEKRAALVNQARDKVAIRITSLSELPKAVENLVVNAVPVELDTGASG